jgi:hypothetical protein
VNSGALVRAAVAAAVLWYVFAGGTVPGVVSTPYTGPLTALHSAAASMESKDKQGLSEALLAIAKMIADDRLGSIKTNADLQKMVEVGLDFGYSTFQVKRYPAVAQAVQAEISKAVGSDAGPVDVATKSRASAALEEAARAIR